MQVAWKPVPFLSVLPICVTNARAGFIAICNFSCTFSVLFTDLKMLKFSSRICDKKIIKFSKHAFREGFVHFLSKNCSNCFFVLDLSNCQGGVGGGMITFLELAHMFDATQIGGFGMLKVFELAHMFDATQIGGFGMLTFFELAHMIAVTQIGGLRRISIPWPCTHDWCYANWWPLED